MVNQLPEHESKSILQPSNAEEVQDCVMAALSNEAPLEVMGGGSKRFYGRSVEAPRVLSLAGMKGMVDYQPHELIAVVRPGTPLAEFENTLAESGQMLAFEPPHWGAAATIGGAVACNLSGPRRVKAGAARDHLLGFQAVTGRGDIVMGGGRVVKNVTGYDLSKLMCGSFGTLAVLTELVLKVLPAAENERTVVLAGLSDGEALAILREAARSPYELSGMAHLPVGMTMPAPVAGLAAGDESMTFLRIEGPAPSVAQRSEQVTQMAKRQTGFLEQGESREVWAAIRELQPLPLQDGESLWRITLPPTSSAAIMDILRGKMPLRGFYDWGGGLIWCALPASAKAADVHRFALEAGGYARLVRASEELDGKTQVFPPLAPTNRNLHVQLKQAFDPNGILNPGRMYEGI
ncbi:MAG: glycolate oxidase subunit GlcE [SAR324 cluster bacterium]|nr:glycolate oxidase subunit GlcE [SAR324 cluster bacterium]